MTLPESFSINSTVGWYSSSFGRVIRSAKRPSGDGNLMEGLSSAVLIAHAAIATKLRNNFIVGSSSFRLPSPTSDAF
jgi:hypothetical protein